VKKPFPDPGKPKIRYQSTSNFLLNVLSKNIDTYENQAFNGLKSLTLKNQTPPRIKLLKNFCTEHAEVFLLNFSLKKPLYL